MKALPLQSRGRAFEENRLMIGITGSRRWRASPVMTSNQ